MTTWCFTYAESDANQQGCNTDIQTQENSAYATVEREIEMKSSSAYAMVSISSSH